MGNVREKMRSKTGKNEPPCPPASLQAFSEYLRTFKVLLTCVMAVSVFGYEHLKTLYTGLSLGSSSGFFSFQMSEAQRLLLGPILVLVETGDGSLIQEVGVGLMDVSAGPGKG